MLHQFLIGTIGADAVFQSRDGREFSTFRVAHNERWQDGDGVNHETTTWVDCIMQGKPAVLPYLKQGTQVAVLGSVSLRVYSSAKDRCMKAGMTINVMRVELLGGKADAVPSQLIDEAGLIHYVTKVYAVDVASVTLRDKRGQTYYADEYGYVTLHTDDTNSQENAKPF